MQLKYAVQFARLKLEAAAKQHQRIMVSVAPAHHASLQLGSIMQPTHTALRCSAASATFEFEEGGPASPFDTIATKWG
eukprot:12720779-Alexandrium_andersonii.AAC.1